MVFGRWIFDYYQRFPDENRDGDDYQARMERERRVLVRIELERAGPHPRAEGGGCGTLHRFRGSEVHDA